MSGNAIGIEDYEDNMPLAKIAAESGDIGFYVPSRMAAFRVQTLFSKEPDTIQWISTFEDGGTFIDVGANVGMYTIWVAMQRAMRVLAFEPEAQNYALLNRNILLNNLGSRVAAYCLALGDEERFTMLNVSDTRIGGSFSTLHGFVNSAAAPEPGAHAKETVFRQGCVSASLDQSWCHRTLSPSSSCSQIPIATRPQIMWYRKSPVGLADQKTHFRSVWKLASGSNIPIDLPNR